MRPVFEASERTSFTVGVTQIRSHVTLVKKYVKHLGQDSYVEP